MVIELSWAKGPSDNLSWKELACKDGTFYPREFIDDGRVNRLAELFERIRRMCGDLPIIVVSAYRTPAHNKRIGGAKFSQHMEGRALDLRPPKGMTVRRFHDIIRTNAFTLGVHGLGIYGTFVHVDIRPTDKLVSWSGDGLKDTRT